MRTVEEILEGLKETVAMQQDKINIMDHKIDALESSLRKEQTINKMMIHFLEKKFGDEIIERVESNI